MTVNWRAEAGQIGLLVGTLLWLTGALIHVQPAFLLLGPELAIDATRLPLPSGLTSTPLLFDTLLFLLGVTAVLVGGAMRFLGGLMTGQKVGGRLAGRILVLEAARYELYAMSLGFVCAAFTVAGHANAVLRLVGFLEGGAAGAAILVMLGRAAGTRANELMRQVLEDGRPDVRSGRG